jgi:hypothetical protein
MSQDDTSQADISSDDLRARLAALDDRAERRSSEILDAAHWDVGIAKAERLAFEQRLYQRWEVPLEVLEREYLYLMDCGQWFESQDWVDVVVSTPAKLKAVSLLARRANRAMGEVLAMLRSGYADGALARCRTLWEIAVVSGALQVHDDSLSEGYLNHSAIDACEAAEDLDRCRDTLAPNDVIDQADLEELRRRKAELIRACGKEYGKPNGWMWPILPAHERPSFAALERLLEMDHQRPYYKLACLNVHADPRSLLDSVGLPSDVSGVNPGASDAGLTLPGQRCALWAGMTTVALMFVGDSEECLLRVGVVSKLAQAAFEWFQEGEERFLQGREEMLESEGHLQNPLE